LVLQPFTRPSMKARGNAVSRRQTVMTFWGVSTMPKGMVE